MLASEPALEAHGMNYKPLAQELLDSMTFRKLPTERSGHISSGERGILS